MQESRVKDFSYVRGDGFEESFSSYDPLSAVEAPFSYDNKTSPLRLSFSCLCAGCRPPRFFEPFHYMEIGHEQSLGILIHAACYPQSRFYLVDANPMHAANVREVALWMGLGNVEVVEATLEAVVGRGLAKMDYVVTRGMLPLLSGSGELRFADMLTNLVKPGGLVVAGYESMPYWSLYRGVIHLMRLVFERARGVLEERVEESFRFLEEGIENKVPFLNNVSVANFVKELKGYDKKHLAVKFLLPPFFRPRYFSEVSQIMSGGKMSYLTSADLQRHMSARGFPEAAKEVLASFDDRLTNELLQDVLLNQSERWDIYGKGRIQATATDIDIFFERMKMVPLRGRGMYANEVRLRMGKLAVPEEAYEDMYSLFDKGTTNCLDVFRETGAKNHGMFLSRIQAAVLLENVGIGFEEEDREREEACGRYHGVLLKWPPNTDYHAASPNTGEGVKLSLFELHGLCFGDEEDKGVLGEKVLESVRGLGGDFRLNGEVVTSGKDFYAKAGDMFDRFVGERRDMFRRLGVKVG